MKIFGNPLPGMPWEERPAGCKDVLWRYSKNPVIPRDLLPDSNSIFNSAVVPFKGGFAGVFRCDDKNRRMTLHVGFSKERSRNGSMAMTRASWRSTAATM